jgi:DNA-binding transcriptional regulator YdaS (Cro superfamily)
MSIFDDLVSHFKTQTKTAEVLGVDQGTVSGWVRKKHGMNPVTALRVEAETDGKFKAIDLCPALKGAQKPAA